MTEQSEDEYKGGYRYVRMRHNVRIDEVLGLRNACSVSARKLPPVAFIMVGGLIWIASVGD